MVHRTVTAEEDVKGTIENVPLKKNAPLNELCPFSWNRVLPSNCRGTSRARAGEVGPKGPELCNYC